MHPEGQINLKAEHPQPASSSMHQDWCISTPGLLGPKKKENEHNQKNKPNEKMQQRETKRNELIKRMMHNKTIRCKERIQTANLPRTQICAWSGAELLGVLWVSCFEVNALRTQNHALNSNTNAKPNHQVAAVIMWKKVWHIKLLERLLWSEANLCLDVLRKKI